MDSTKTSKLYIPIYGWDVPLVFFPTEKTFTAYVNKLGISETSKQYIISEYKKRMWMDAILFKVSEGCLMVFHRRMLKDTVPNCMGTIAHEAFHLTCEILHKSGVKLTDDSEEAFAYLLGFITHGIYKEMTA